MDFRPIKNFSNETFRDYAGDIATFTAAAVNDEGISEPEMIDRMPGIIRKIHCLGSILEIAAIDGWEHKPARQKNWDFYFDDACAFIDELSLEKLKENFLKARENDDNEEELIKLTEELREIMPEVTEILDNFMIENNDELYREWKPGLKP